MAALAYLLLPVSGAVAFFTASSARVRFHGLQAVALGALWPLSLYAAAAVSPGATSLAALAGAALWIFLMVATALGFDPAVPGARRLFELTEGPRAGG